MSRVPVWLAVSVGVAVMAGAAEKPASEAPFSARLAARLAAQPPGSPVRAWVFFRDKEKGQESWGEARARLSPRALARRQKRGSRPGLEEADLAVTPAYVRAVADRVRRVRHVSRWLNAASVEATEAELRTLAALPFVARIDLLAAGRRLPEPKPDVARTSGPARRHLSGIDYGPSEGQLAQLRVPEVHDLGLNGTGVVVAVFDTGFDTHESLSAMPILAARDFVNGDDDVRTGADRGDASHGTAVLSVLGGYMPGQLVGPAFGATFVLAKTEDTWSETPVEEDHWAAAAEWADALGVDVISSSLGYLQFDFGWPSHLPADLNGQVTVVTRAADLAAERGIVVVNSAGNAGDDPVQNTLGAPADGFLVLATAAVSATGERAVFSSVGPTPDGRVKPDLAAQGLATYAADTGDFPYRTLSGTSLSCPLVAGVAALVLQAHPEYTVAQVHHVLRATASQASSPDNLLGWGIVNALAAVAAEVPPAAEAP
jgi:subtilisin family serine protease